MSDGDQRFIRWKEEQDGNVFPATTAIDRELYLQKLDKKVAELIETLAQLRLTMFGTFDELAKAITTNTEKLTKLIDKIATIELYQMNGWSR